MERVFLMSRETKISIRGIMRRIGRIYGDSDLFSLLMQYAESARLAVRGRIKYQNFFSAVKNAVIPEKLTDPGLISAAVSPDGRSFSYRELSLFNAYAAIIAVSELDVPIRSDRALCDTVEYLKALDSIPAEEIFFRLSEAERILSDSEYFSGADEKTKNACRRNVSEFARKYSLTEAGAARILCDGDPLPKMNGIAARLYFPFCAVILAGLLVGTAFAVGGNLLPWLFLVLPLTELTRELADSVFSRLVKHRPVPALDLKTVPDNGKVLCVITSLLSSEKEADALAAKIRNCCFSNRGENVNFGLLCDLREADSAVTADDGRLISYTEKLIDRLNSEHGCGIFLFVRSRRFAPTEGKYMGWERKRGAVIELTRLLRGKENRISVHCADVTALDGTKYVITLDSDTRLYNGAVRDMVGSMLHPSNRPVIKDGRVVSGYAIMQPRTEASLASAERTPFSVLSAGNGGTDIYASAAYETYQTVFGEGIFCGKGIFDVDAFSALIDGAFADGRILSHDLPEGTRLRAAALTDIALTDNLPRDPLSCFDRQHRWIRGDVQSLALLGKYVENSDGELYPNPINSLSKFKIADNVRRALVPVSAFIALLLCIFLPYRYSVWGTAAALSYLIFPFVLSVLTLMKSSGRRFFSYVMPGVFRAAGGFLYGVSSLFHNAVISADAVMRAGWRMLFSGRKTLEWKTASDAENGIRGLPLFLFRMLPSMLAGIAVAVFCPVTVIRVIGILNALFPFAAYLSGREFPESPHIGKAEIAQITEYASDIWRFFNDCVTEADGYLPPDNIQLSPLEVTAHRTSPTNIGLYMLSCAAACEFGFINRGELLTRLEKTLSTVEKLPKLGGHLYNWYDTEKLSILGQPYISTVDSGNFTACLVTLRGYLSGDGLREKRVNDRLGNIIRGADFGLLFDSERKLFRIGINAVTGTGEGWYDLFMSEARTTSYYAIATGQVPREHWKRLSRPLISRDGYIGLASWTGTAFEYLMPTLFLPTCFGSLSYESVSFAIREQKKDKVRGLYGKSESGYFTFDPDLNYQYRAFGVQSLGLKRGLYKDSVISPYSSFLALPFSPVASLMNLGRISEHDMYGKYGFYEAIDLTPSRVGGGSAVIRSYMSHHMGMSLAACANACFGGIFIKCFMSDPETASSSELLEEKVPVDAHISRVSGSAVQNADRADRSPVIRQEKRQPDGNSAYTVSENGITVCAYRDMLKFLFSGNDLSVDPFVFGRIRRPRLLFSVDGEIHDALASGCVPENHGGTLTFTDDEKDFCAKTGITVSGKHRCIVISFTARGHFSRICPMLCFEPCLTPTSKRAAHPAYCDIMITAEYLSDRSLILYSVNDHGGGEGLCIAVSFECRGGNEEYLLTRSGLGLMYGERDVEALVTADFPDTVYSVGEPFCAVKKESKCPGGKYAANILITVGKGRGDAVSSMLAVRQEYRRRGAYGRFSAAAARSAAERAAACGKRYDGRYTGLMLARTLLNCNAGFCDSPHGIGELYRHGISGDLPIFCLDVTDTLTDGSPAAVTAAGFIAAHKYLSLCGIRTDLVIFYESDGDYGGKQREAINALCDAAASAFLIGHRGGIFPIEGRDTAVIAASSLYVKVTRETTIEGITAAYAVPPYIEDDTVIRPSVYLAHTTEEDEIPVYGGCFTDSGFDIFKGTQSAPWSYVYAKGHFGTLLTQNSLGYTWIGNCHERRITPYSPDALLDFSGERLIFTGGGKRYDLAACASKVSWKRGAAVWSGSIGKTEYTVSVTVDTKLPCKLIYVDIPDGAEVNYEIDPVMGERQSPSRPVIRREREGTVFFIPGITGGRIYDIGFLAEKRFSGKRLFILGAFPTGGIKTFEAVMRKYSDAGSFESAVWEYERSTASLLPDLKISGCDRGIAAMSEYYLPYQALVCRFFARTGFYQSGGAYGFRDQLQDCLCIMHGAPDIARTHILRAASHQYCEGDVMHWWHTVHGVSAGVRTHYSDDLLWLPYVTAEYVFLTGDRDILDVSLPYLSSEELPDDCPDRYESPEKSRFRESLYSHCVRAIERSLDTGAHGLPYMRGGDWNDGMNLVGNGGGESVWLGMFLVTVLERFIPIAAGEGDLSGAAKYREAVRRLKNACRSCFDTDRFARAYYSDGSPLGTNEAADALPQAFSVFAGIDRGMSETALKTAEKLLFDRKNRIFGLLAPPYGACDGRTPGYIASYPPGIRENGGQYTHAAVWYAMACADAGLNTTAAEVLLTIAPSSVCSLPEDAVKYRGEPYFLAGDVSSNPSCPGRCGWSVYTGAAGWFYIAVTEKLLGISLSSDSFSVTPALSDKFPSYRAVFRFRGTEYTVTAGIGDRNRWKLDGEYVNNLFYFDNRRHLLEITVEKKHGMS